MNTIFTDVYINDWVIIFSFISDMQTRRDMLVAQFRSNVCFIIIYLILCSKVWTIDKDKFWSLSLSLSLLLIQQQKLSSCGVLYWQDTWHTPANTNDQTRHMGTFYEYDVSRTKSRSLCPVYWLLTYIIEKKTLPVLWKYPHLVFCQPRPNTTFGLGWPNVVCCYVYTQWRWYIAYQR